MSELVGAKGVVAARPTVIRGNGEVEDHSQNTPPLTPANEPPLITLLKDIKANPSNYTNNVVFDKIMAIARQDIQACAEARLQQTAEMHFNLIALAFSTIQKALLHLHGVTAVQAPQQAAPPQENLIKL